MRRPSFYEIWRVDRSKRSTHQPWHYRKIICISTLDRRSAALAAIDVWGNWLLLYHLSNVIKSVHVKNTTQVLFSARQQLEKEQWHNASLLVPITNLCQIIMQIKCILFAHILAGRYIFSTQSWSSHLKIDWHHFLDWFGSIIFHF